MAWVKIKIEGTFWTTQNINVASILPMTHPDWILFYFNTISKETTPMINWASQKIKRRHCSFWKSRKNRRCNLRRSDYFNSFYQGCRHLIVRRVCVSLTCENARLRIKFKFNLIIDCLKNISVCIIRDGKEESSSQITDENSSQITDENSSQIIDENGTKY